MILKTRQVAKVNSFFSISFPSPSFSSFFFRISTPFLCKHGHRKASQFQRPLKNSPQNRQTKCNNNMDHFFLGIDLPHLVVHCGVAYSSNMVMNVFRYNWNIMSKGICNGYHWNVLFLVHKIILKTFIFLSMLKWHPMKAT